MSILRPILFFALAAFALSPWSSPALSLLLGLIFALTLGAPYPKQVKRASKLTLQAAVVGLGFGLALQTMLRVGANGLQITLITILITYLIGALLGRILKVHRKSSLLIATGTAICGGSAIAAVGPVIHASDEEMSVSLGTVFILNSIALFLFPWIGHLLQLPQIGFGVWAALGIHDTSSVVGAAASYGHEALGIATSIKLARALWIVPLALLFAWLETRHVRKQAESDAHRPKIQIPWFIGLFVLASVLRSLIPAATNSFNVIADVSRNVLSLTLFLIGTGLSRSALKSVGARPFILGIILWVIAGSIGLLVSMYSASVFS